MPSRSAEQHDFRGPAGQRGVAREHISTTRRLRVLDVRGRHPSSVAAARQARRVRRGPHPRRRVRGLGARLRRRRRPGAGAGRRRRGVRAPEPASSGIGDGDLRRHLRRLLRDLRRPRGLGVPALRRRGARARRRLDHLEGRGPSGRPTRSPHRCPGDFTRAAPAAAAANARRGRGRARAEARRSSMRARATCSSASGARRTPGTSRARAAFPTRSSSTARPGYGPPRRRSPGWPGTPASTRSSPPRELIATCGSGVSATVALLALERIGVHCDGVYDGSFNEWSADARRPSRLWAGLRRAEHLGRGTAGSP